MHIPDKSQIVLVSRCLAYCLPPFFDQFEDLVLDARRMHGRAFGKSADKLVQELLCADLQMERITAVFDTDVKELFKSELEGV